jgi:hypothetical protein
MLLNDLTTMIEGHLAAYCGASIWMRSFPFITELPPKFLQLHCPEVIDLPAAFVSLDEHDEAFLAIHLSDRVHLSITSANSAASLLASREGIDALLILIEEISHFHHFIDHTTKSETISRFELELVAELQKIAIASLIAHDLFGRSYLQELIHMVYSESMIHSQMTDYAKISKLGERFWKQHLKKHGPTLLKERSFRQQLQNFTQNISLCKRQLLENLTAA